MSVSSRSTSVTIKLNARVDVSKIAALLADASRARMLTALLDGQSLTATELAYQAGVSPQTASSHLAKLTEASLLAVETQGRSRSYRLARPAVAGALEALLAVAPRGALPETERSPAVEALRVARTCYDHLAGRLGVALTDVMVNRRSLRPVGPDFQLTESGEAFFRTMGVNVEQARRQRRVFARQCLDWTERRPHLAGALGAALAGRWLEMKWVRRVPAERSLVLTDQGKDTLRKRFALSFTNVVGNTRARR